jgi:asparaginyl-tRNA synthetase
MTVAYIEDIARYDGQEVTLRGWLYNRTPKGKLQFLVLRDGTGMMQAVAYRPEVGEEVWARCESLTQESSVLVTGVVKKDARSAGGYEMSLKNLEIVQVAEEYPISLKEHGTAFLMEHRHLWLRSTRQHAILKIRAEIIRATRDFLDDSGFTLVDSPILTPAACEGTSTLFETDYFEEKAYLSQSGQLYNEATIGALGRTYCFGPTFRAEKSKTRRHLMEFWMVEPEAAFYTQEDNQVLQENMVSHIVQTVLKNRAAELKTLERDVAVLERVLPPFPRVTYDEAVDILNAHDKPMAWGDDIGGDEETVLAEQYDKPIFVTNYPAKIKAFYMQPNPERPDVVLCADMLAPEGYGEIIGGSQRIHDLKLLEQRLIANKLPPEAFKWYLDLRRYGSVPHSGFGMGIERMVAWICKLPHIRETIPFPRMLDKIYP